MRLKNKPAQEDRFFHDSVPLPPKSPYAREDVEQALQDNATEETLSQWRELCALPGMDMIMDSPVALFDSLRPNSIAGGMAVELLQVLENKLPLPKFLIAQGLLPVLLHQDSLMHFTFFCYGERSRTMGRPMEVMDRDIQSIAFSTSHNLCNYQENMKSHIETTGVVPSKVFQARDRAAMRAFLSVLSDVKENTAVPVFLSQDLMDKPRHWHRGLLADYVAFKVGEELESKLFFGRGSYSPERRLVGDTFNLGKSIVERTMGYSQRGRGECYRDQPIPPIAEILLDNRGLLTGADVVTLVLLAMEYNDEWSAALA